jgi:hypothetical protein
MKPDSAERSLDLQRGFAKLAQSSFRIRISVLVLLLISLFVVWSTLTSGMVAAEKVDMDFCTMIYKDPYFFPRTWLGNASCTQSNYALTIRTARHAHDNDAPYPKTMSPDEVTKHIQQFLDHYQEFQAYDWNRRQAFRIQLSLPYARNPVSLDGQLISDAWPFCALLGLSVAMAWKFRQTCYEIHLSALITKTKPEKIRERNFALTEFLAGNIAAISIDGRNIFLYGKPVGLIPEVVLSGGLLLAVVLLLLNLLTEFGPQFTPRGEELFSDSYYFWLYVFAVVLFLLLLRVRKRWRVSLAEVVGGEVRSARLFFLYKLRRFLHHRTLAGIRWEDALVFLCALLGVASLFLSWADYRGLALLWNPTEVFDDMPVAARLVQAEMLFTVAFLFVSPISRIRNLPLGERLLRFLQTARNFGARFVLIFSGFVIAYAFVGVYGLFKNWYVWPTLVGPNFNTFQVLENLPTLGDADFSLGFTAFTASCGILSLLELWFEAQLTPEEKGPEFV